MSALKSLLNSFSTSPGGWSGRKLTAAMLAGCIAASHIMWYVYALAYRDFALFITVLVIDLIGIGFFLSMVTVQQIIELKNGKKDEA